MASTFKAIAEHMSSTFAMRTRENTSLQYLPSKTYNGARGRVPWGGPSRVCGQPNKDGSDICAVHRSNSGRLVASADSFGRLRLFRYPCLTQGAGNKTFRGHTAAITKVRFTADDGYVLTSGGDDRCIFQWKVQEYAEDTAIVAGDSGKDSDVDAEGIFDDSSAKKEEFVAVKPWVGAVVAPTNAPEDDPTAPDSVV